VPAGRDAGRAGARGEGARGEGARRAPRPPSTPPAPGPRPEPGPGAEPDLFEYAVLRVVPRVERGECVNVGVVLFCRTRRFLDVRLEPDEARLLALAPDLDLAAVRRHLELIRLVCAGDPAAGPIARLPQPERFGWLVAPASTVVQPGPVHTALGADPAAALDRLLATMVRLPDGGRESGGGSQE
jgi:Protein of unknown function (DUF3037)